MTKKKYYNLCGIFFAAIVLILTIVFIVLPDNKYSSTEKRNLKSLPEFNFDTIKSGQFMSEMESYMADQFPMRNNIVYAKTFIDVLLGQKEANGVFFCKNGYLMEKFEEKASDNTEETFKAVAEFAQRHTDANMYFMLVPNAISVYSELIPENASVADQNAYISRAYNATKDYLTFVDLIDTFKSVKTYVNLYYRTDHHWTTDGANVAYNQLKELMSLSAEEYTSGCVCNSFIGSLASKSGYSPYQKDAINIYMPVSEQLYTVTIGTQISSSVYFTDKLVSDNQYELFMGGNYPEVTIKTVVDTDRKLLLVKDSYANCFIPFLLGSFSEIRVIDPRYYYDDIDMLIEAGDYSDVLFLYNVNTLSQDTNLKAILNH